ncbi:DUF4112 domain-containing protein [Novispirillum sp. DQ9]|uniref:DUF4112 domain-containing protein n=1 Tax=Novispirillum sp. DQ9 TaxID=3398612 RepID=UPI003C7B3F8B
MERPRDRGDDGDRRRRLDRLRLLAYWLDDRFRLPGTSLRIGVDGLAGLVPGIGDTVTAAVAAWIVIEGWRLGLPRSAVLAMAGRAGLDWVVGSIPVAGDLFDIGYKANRRNVARILHHFGERWE